MATKKSDSEQPERKEAQSPRGSDLTSLVEAFQRFAGSEAMLELGKRLAASQEAISRFAGSEAMQELVKRLAANQEVLRRFAGSEAMQELGKRIAANQEVFRRFAGSEAMQELGKRIAANQEVLGRFTALSRSGLEGNQEQRKAFAQWAAASAPVLSFETSPSPPEQPHPSTPPKEVSSPEPANDLFKGHSPDGWQKTRDGTRVTKALENHSKLPLFVLAVDIRRSTDLMKEARDPYEFAETIGTFVTTARDVIWQEGGVFDKFTGDGLLAYWSYQANHKDRTLARIFAVCRNLYSLFREKALPRLQINSQNLPSKTGLAIGLDEGDAFVVRVVDGPTVVGPSVVGAVRMVSAAQPWETLLNNHLGEFLRRRTDQTRFRSIEILKVPRETKEYEPQSAFAVKFRDLILSDLE